MGNRTAMLDLAALTKRICGLRICGNLIRCYVHQDYFIRRELTVKSCSKAKASVESSRHSSNHKRSFQTYAHPSYNRLMGVVDLLHKNLLTVTFRNGPIIATKRQRQRHW